MVKVKVARNGAMIMGIDFPNSDTTVYDVFEDDNYYYIIIILHILNIAFYANGYL